MAGSPLLIVFAGPNGSGKSTLAEEMRARDPGFPSLYINADDIARKQKIGPREAAVEAARRRAEALARNVSFATETVMSTVEEIDFLKDAKRAGYEITLLYITTQSRKINLKRIQTRVKMGGHDVPPDKTSSRYDRSMTFLAEALKIVDVATIYNNSFEHPLLIVEKTRDGQLVLYPQEPPSIWNVERIRKLVGLATKSPSVSEP
jgi:predicted ABC-type ATPase